MSGVVDRLDSALIEPSVVSLLIGTNDLAGLGESARVPDVADRMHTLVTRIREKAPGAKLLVNSVMPRAAAFANAVCELNDRYRVIASAAGATYVDAWPALADVRGALRRDFTRDDLHLNGAGYAAWVELLRPHLGRP